MRVLRAQISPQVHPFNDPYVIAGQGTIGMEIVKQTTTVKERLHAVFI